MNANLIKLRMIFDHLSLRNRAIISSATLLIVFLLWVLLLYSPQARKMSQNKVQIDQSVQIASELSLKTRTIKNLAADNTAVKLMDKYNQMQERMKTLDKKMERYTNRFINDRQLSKLLHSMLNATTGVSIQDFSTIDYINQQAIQEIKDDFSQDGASSQSQGKFGKVNVSNVSKGVSLDGNLPADRTQYTLVLRGDYFSIVNYLKLLEKLPWQLYWDKLNYKVDAYPIGLVEIQFYTLRPKEDMGIKSVASEPKK